MEEIERIDSDGRMKADQWRSRVAEYGRTLKTPPPEDYESADVVVLQGEERPTWSVWYHLWTEEEGKSDLGLQLTVYYDGRSVLIEADDLRVP